MVSKLPWWSNQKISVISDERRHLYTISHLDSSRVKRECGVKIAKYIKNFVRKPMKKNKISKKKLLRAFTYIHQNKNVFHY